MILTLYSFHAGDMLSEARGYVIAENEQEAMFLINNRTSRLWDRENVELDDIGLASEPRIIVTETH